MYMSSSATCRPEDSTKGQTRRKAGTQSHGTHAVSRATEREGTSMFRTQALAVPARLSPLRARVWARVVRPEDIQEATRWLFAVLALVSIVLSLPATLAAADGARLLVILASSAVLGLSWGAGYLRSSAPLVMDVVDAAAMTAFALAGPEPSVVYMIVFTALWFRSLYGSGARAVLRCALYTLSLIHISEPTRRTPIS